MSGCGDCLYKGTTGIVLSEMTPYLEEKLSLNRNNNTLAERLTEVAYSQFFNNINGKRGMAFPGIVISYFGDPSTAAVVDSYEAKMLERGLRIEDGKFIPTKPSCGGVEIDPTFLTPEMINFAAMRELIMGAKSYGIGPDEGIYMITDQKKGCCKFPIIIEANTDELITLVKRINDEGVNYER